MSIVTEKIIQTINFFAHKEGGKINRLKLMKLIWLADRTHLTKYGRMVLRDKYHALPHGPVPSQTMDISRYPFTEEIKGSRFDVLSNSKFNDKYFSKTDIEVLEKVWEKFGHLSEYELRDLSHEYPEWLRFKANLEEEGQPNSYEMVLDDFFEKNDEKINILDLDNPHLNEVRKEFLSKRSIENFLNS